MIALAGDADVVPSGFSAVDHARRGSKSSKLGFYQNSDREQKMKN
ncbi:hypothetical protein [Calidifontibacillus erzurumensis]